MIGLIREFKTFIVKGNAVDLAVGIIIGAAFGAMVSSLVKDVVMPPIGVLMGGVDFSDLAIQLQSKHKAGDTLINGMTAKKDMEAVYLRYGSFINAVIALVIQGFCIFLVVKLINRLKREEAVAPSAPPAPSSEEKLLIEIRDLLAGQRTVAPTPPIPPQG